MENVRDREVVMQRSPNQSEGGSGDSHPGRDARSTSCFGKPIAGNSNGLLT
jgi:hypothetical protein